MAKNKKQPKSKNSQPVGSPVTLRTEPLPYRTWGEQHIEKSASDQMDAALTLPIAVAGALMPDAHVGYGLPIGGVLATDATVIPYAVGVDIACRMRLSVYPEPPDLLKRMPDRLEKALVEQTRFGAGSSFEPHQRPEHPVMDHLAWEDTRRLKSLKDKGYAQLGTSGSGNHFVEWGVFELPEDDEGLELQAGNYLALLSHSGSRGIGYAIANHYSALASSLHNLDKHVQHLGWLSLESEDGQAYWEAMQLAGLYAAANHEIIHERVAKAAGVKPLLTIENHHNFAWEETYTHADGTEQQVIVHRKGATPAGVGVMGIIPGSMGDAGYIVRGRGVNSALNSASHGAGRLMSRREARQTITKTEQDQYLDAHHVKLIGGDLDEAPQAYKSIERVIAAQSDLVDIVATFAPRIVRMDGKARR